MTVSIEMLQKLLSYDAATGILSWKERAMVGPWNRFANKPALNHVATDGYLKGTILRKSVSAHRIIWALHYGEWPDQIDHINGVKTDNRIENLRSVSRPENLKNKRLQTNNTSGVMGVYWRNDRKRWVAQIGINGKPTTLGYFSSKFDALSKRKLAEIEHGYHQNHGTAP